MRVKYICYLITLFALLSVSTFSTQAQTVLSYGTGTTGTLSSSVPVVVYTFQGEVDDAVTLQVISLSESLQPAVSINSLTGVQVATSSSDPFSVSPGTARASVRLPESGIYTVIVTSLAGSTGDFAIRLDGVPTSQQSELTTESPITESISAGTSALLYTVTADENTPLIVTLTALTEGTIYSVRVLDFSGTSIALLSGNTQQNATVVIPAGTGIYTLEVTVNATTEGQFNIDVVPLGEQITEVDATEAATETQADTAVTPTFTPTMLTDTTDATATVAAPTVVPSATTAQQNNAPTPTMAATVAPNMATPTPTSSYTPTLMATATFTPSYTPTTPPAAQIAPEDTRFNNALAIPLDSTTSVLDFVSFPDGDSEDRVRYEVTGMNNNVAITGGRAQLVISATCFGENTDQIEFFTGGQTYSCGQTLVDREVTADSDTGSIVITAIGGEGTYVQWVLTGTATRLN